MSNLNRTRQYHLRQTHIPYSQRKKLSKKLDYDDDDDIISVPLTTPTKRGSDVSKLTLKLKLGRKTGVCLSKSAPCTPVPCSKEAEEAEAEESLNVVKSNLSKKESLPQVESHAIESLSNSPVALDTTPSRKSTRSKKCVDLYKPEDYRTPSKSSSRKVLFVEEQSNSPNRRQVKATAIELVFTETGLQTRLKKITDCASGSIESSKGGNNCTAAEIGSPFKSTPKKSPTKRKSPTKLSTQENVDVSPKKITKFFERKSHSKQLNLYQQFKHALSTSNHEKLVYRERETMEVERFLRLNIDQKHSDSLYVYGPPGTGKTATVKSILNTLEGEKYPFRVICLNGMSFTTDNGFYQKMLSELGHKNHVPQKNLVTTIEKLICSRSKMLVLLLDEIDALQSNNSKHQNLLLTVFGWPRIAGSKLIIVGISNTLDLTINHLVRIHSLKLDPIKEIAFNPYVKDEILGILRNRLQKLREQGPNLIDDAAIELCARKVANCGDVRKALDILRRSIELVEQEEKEKNCPLKSLVDNCEGSQPNLDDATNSMQRNHELSPSADLTPSPTPALAKVKIVHVIKILNQVFGNKVVQVKEDEHNFPLQQQLVLCVCLVLMREGCKEVEVGKCYDTFDRICKQKGLSNDIANTGDFISMCYLLEAKGFVSLRSAKDIRSTKLSLAVEESEVRTMLKGKSLFISILNSSAS